MKSTTALRFTKFAASLILIVGLHASALASCGDTLSAMAAGAAFVENQSHQMQQESQSSGDNAVHSSIVGLWHVRFIVGDQTIQEAYQIWNAGGTEVHNPNVDPRAGNVCLGVWTKTSNGAIKLTHRVWNYDTTGDFGGTIHLHETVNLSQGGNKQTGSFKLDFYDPSGVFQMEVSGSIRGERISVE
jgi:hypothetical protein